jgi:hypothetical protein
VHTERVDFEGGAADVRIALRDLGLSPPALYQRSRRQLARDTLSGSIKSSLKPREPIRDCDRFDGTPLMQAHG